MKLRLLLIQIIASVSTLFAQQVLAQTFVYQKNTSMFSRALAGNDSNPLSIEEFNSIESNINAENNWVRSSEAISKELLIADGWVFYTGIQSPYDANVWLCLERTIIGNDYHLFLYNSQSHQKQIVIQKEGSPQPNFAYRPIAWSHNADEVYLERIEFDTDKKHEGLVKFDTKSLKTSQLLISNNYMSTPILSPDKKHFVYTATSEYPRELVHGMADKLIVYSISNEQETIVDAEVSSNYFVVGWYDSNYKNTSSIVPTATAQLDFKLPWEAGKTYCVTRDGSNSPPGSPGSSSSCSNLGAHSYPAALDFDTPNNANDKVLAVAAGTVTAVIYSTTGYGNHIIITHSDNYRTRYAHLFSIAVSQGQAVQQGCYLGIEGTTGGSSGDHIHFEYEYPGGSGNLYSTFDDCGGCVPHRGYAYTSVNTLQPCASIAAPPAPMIANASGCGTVVLSQATPPAGVTYYWQGTSCGTSTTDASPTYTVTSSGNYKLRARNTSGVWSSTCSSVNVTVNGAPSAPPTPTVSTNNCGPKILTSPTPPAGVTYYWQTTCNNSTSNSAPTFTATTSGTYRLRANSGTNCWSDNCAAVSVIVNENPSPVIAGQNAVCTSSNNIVYSVVNTGNTFAWSITGGTIVSGQGTYSVTVNWTSIGTGSLTVTETNTSTGCSGTQTLNVNVGSGLSPVITPNGPLRFCVGGQVILDAGTGYSSYLWSNGANTQQITVTQPGTYSVSVADNSGCSGSSFFGATVIVDSLPPVPTISYSNSVMTSSAPAGNQWYLDNMLIGGATAQTYTANQMGNYTVVATNPLTGCSNTSAPFNPANVGIEDREESIVFAIYPNPNNGTFTVKIDDVNSEPVKVAVFNTLGECVWKEESKKNEINVMLTNYSSGIYYIQIEVKNKTYRSKVSVN